MDLKKLPNNITEHIAGMTLIKDPTGRSEANVYRFTNERKVMFLKHICDFKEFEHEVVMNKWLQGKLSVPKIVTSVSVKNENYLLMNAVSGNMAKSNQFVENPRELVEILANGIKQMQELDIEDCPYKITLDHKLELAHERIVNHLVDMEDWEESTQFSSPFDLYEFLIQNKPKDDFVFSHGDFTFSNIFIRENTVSGYIDLCKSGISNIWQDISLCVRSLRHMDVEEEYIEQFFNHLGIEPDFKMIEYFILLDELF